jgi:two-component system sensor histidine kinase YesM
MQLHKGRDLHPGFSVRHLFPRLCDIKLKDKLILLSMLVAVTISAFSALSFSYAIGRCDRLLYSQTANSLSFFSDELTNQLENISATSSYLVFDKSFQENLYTFDIQDEFTLKALNAKNDVWGLLKHYYDSNMISLCVVPRSKAPIWWGESAISEPESAMNRLFARCDEAKGKLVWTASAAGDGSILCARKILRTRDLSLENMGYLVIRVNLAKIVNSISQSRYTNGQQFHIFIRSPEKPVYPLSGDSGWFRQVQPLTDDTPYAVQQVNGSRMFVTFTRLRFTGPDWWMALGVPYDDIFQSVVFSKVLYLLAVLTAIVLSMIFSGFIVKGITKHFNTLVTKMNRLKSGNFELLESEEKVGNDEIGFLNRYFDKMTVEFKKMIDDNYVKELLIAQSRLKSLEQQINPHFLYNTLDSINWFARCGGDTRISTMVESLGVLLRSSLNQQEDVIPLSQELDIVKSYVRIQKIRFADTLTVDFDLDEEVLSVPIPKMTIQPLVENAIQYSQEEILEESRIAIRVKDAGAEVAVCVENSGSEIDTDILNRLKQGSAKPKGQGIGLVNIDSRIKIIFGEKYGLRFRNENDCAAVFFTIPKTGAPAPGKEGSTC